MAAPHLSILLGHMLPKGGEHEDEEMDDSEYKKYEQAMEKFIEAIHAEDVDKACKAFLAVHEMVSPDGSHRDPQGEEEHETEEERAAEGEEDQEAAE